MKPRGITPRILESLNDSPVVYLQGARQTGKSTLVQAIAEEQHPARYLTLDDATTLAAAHEDPQAFVNGFREPMIIDEIQRVPELALAIKTVVDKRRDPGRFLLTGSASVLLLPKVSESLAGRIEIHTLWPFSQGELTGTKERFIDEAFESDFDASVSVSTSHRSDLIARIVQGGYPVVAERRSHDRRRAWFGSYITTILQRDVRDMASIEGLTAMPRLLSLLASRAGALLNYAELSRSLSMPQTTLKRYMTLLETTFLVQLLPAWSSNLGKRLVKSPKIMLVDSGLLCHLTGSDVTRLGDNPTLLGDKLENFVVMELRKQSGWSRIRPALFHFRTSVGIEVDIVLESASGDVVGIEVKASTAVKPHDFSGLKALRELIGARFKRGIVLYLGSEPLPFGRDLLALPVSAIWGGG